MCHCIYFMCETSIINWKRLWDLLFMLPITWFFFRTLLRQLVWCSYTSLQRTRLSSITQTQITFLIGNERLTPITASAPSRQAQWPLWCVSARMQGWRWSIFPPTLLPQEPAEKWKHLFDAFSKHLSEIRAIGTRKGGRVAAVTRCRFLQMQWNAEWEIWQSHQLLSSWWCWLEI